MVAQQRHRRLAAEFIIGFVDQHQAFGIGHHNRQRVRIQKRAGGIVGAAHNDHI